MAEKLIFVVGPTAVGKTEVCVELAGMLDYELISCDSMQVYKGMDIATSKPPKELRDRIAHHLIDVIEPSQEFSVAQFRQLAVKAMEGIIARGKSPLFTGGSGLYVKVLIDGLFEGPSGDREFRARLKAEAQEFGAGILYKRLQEADAETADNIHPNDLRRILRALEVCEKAEAPMSKLKGGTRGLGGRYEVRMFGLNRDRRALYKRIDERVDAMFGAGLVEEAKRLMGQGPGLTASQALGYKEVFGFLNGECELEEAVRLVKRNTRRYAKRQLTWFRRDKRIEWIELGEDFGPRQAAEKIWKELS